MASCELCGTDTDELNRAKIEGATLSVCSTCADHGTVVDRQSEEEESASSTKYSTGSNSGQNDSSERRTDQTPMGGADDVVPDYDRRIQQGREQKGMSRDELANRINEKASFIGRLERGESLPNGDIQHKLETELEIELDAGSTPSHDNGDGSGDNSGLTLGDVVKRDRD